MTPAELDDLDRRLRYGAEQACWAAPTEAKNEIRWIAADVIRELRQLVTHYEMSMGVGDGSGQLFVHGSYDSIKAAQRIVDERDALAERVKVLEDAIRRSANNIEIWSVGPSSEHFTELVAAKDLLDAALRAQEKT